jgi:D-alanyl-D-alanine carboxypeptidase
MNPMKKFTLTIIILFMTLILTVCQNKKNLKEKQELSNKLQSHVESIISNEGEFPIHNSVLLVDCPKIKWKGAAGKADGKNELMTADHKIKLASIGKTFTATVILQLYEDGYLKLDDTIDKYLDNPVVKLDSLMIYQGISYGREITIRQLLHHTSGISDYMEDQRFIPDVIANPQKQYTPAKIMAIYYEYDTNHDALFPPGTDFNYSDVNYVLLAMIIEQVTGENYHSQLKSRIFDPLKMKNSFLEYYEEPRGKQPLSHAFYSTMDLVADVNTSFDWGGGGIISTCEELNTFFRALVDGKLFKKKETLKLMLETADEGLGGMDYDYGLGIMKRNLHGFIFYGHGGAYDCDVFYCPEKNVSVCMSLNQMETHGQRDEFLLDAIEFVL